MSMLKKRAIHMSVLESCFMLSCRGVRGSRAALVMPAILPSSVETPVAVTWALACPFVMTVPAKTMSCRSLGRASGNACTAASLAAGNDSPVKVDSSTSNPTDSRSFASAGTRSPGFKRSMSPGTTCNVGTSTVFPSRSTVVVGDASLRKVVMDFLARYSFQTSAKTRHGNHKDDC